MSLCKYANIFGAPGTGAHSWRVANTAIVDLAATVLLAYVTKLALDKLRPESAPHSFWVILLVWLVIGEVSHYAFCVQTGWLSALGVDAKAGS